MYVREDKSGEKVVEFLTTHVFGPERVEALRARLAEIGPEADNVHAEVERLRSDLDAIKKRIRRRLTNLEAEEPSSEIADDIRTGLEEFGALRAKKQRALEAAERDEPRARPGVRRSAGWRAAASGRGLGARERPGLPGAARGSQL